MPAAILPSHLETFTAARWPDRRRVFGRWLMPLGIGHILLLSRLGNPLVGGSQPFDSSAVGTVVAICSLPARRAAGHAVGWLFPWRVLYFSLLSACSRTAVARVTRYLMHGTKRPAMVRQSSGGSSAVPFWLTVLSTLMREYGMTEGEALEYPAAAAIWLCVPAWESWGGVRLASETELAAVEEMRADAAAAEHGGTRA